MLKRILRRGRAPLVAAPAVPDDTRVYAIGDVHGRRDLLDELLDMIAHDERERGPVDRTTLILLGDLVDRGPDSAGVVARALSLQQTKRDCRFLLGNHEEVLLSALDGEADALKFFCRFGGRETILSYGISERDYHDMGYDELAAALAEQVPDAHRTFLANFEDLIVIGDYAFVHAGVRPDVPLAEQKGSDLRWIRRQFLGHERGFEKVIVHGHTISDGVDRGTDRIGIDTGAYESGVLTAIGLQGTDQWFLATGAAK